MVKLNTHKGVVFFTDDFPEGLGTLENTGIDAFFGIASSETIVVLVLLP